MSWIMLKVFPTDLSKEKFNTLCCTHENLQNADFKTCLCKMGLETLPGFPKTVPCGTLSAVFIGCGLILVFAGLVLGFPGKFP